MDTDEEAHGGSESDIHTLHYWSRVSFLSLVAGGIVWAALGVLRLYRGMAWYQADELTGSTAAVSDLSWGVACLALAVLAFLVAGRLRADIVSVFERRRFQVPRERLAVYGLLGFPLGLVISGVLLVLVNVKLSHPEFLPSHAEAYPEAMPAPPAPAPAPPAWAPLAMPTPAAPAEAPSNEVLPAPAAAYVPLPPSTAPVMATYVELPQGPAAGQPSPTAAAAEAPPVIATVEEAPVEAPPTVEAAPPMEVPPPEGAVPAPPAVEGVPAQPETFEEVTATSTIEELPEETTGPKDIKTAHEELMRKLLGKG